MDTQRPIKKIVNPTPEEIQAFSKDLDELLKKHSFILQPTLKINATGITPENKVFKIVEETPKIEVPPTPANPQSEVDKKAIN